MSSSDTELQGSASKICSTKSFCLQKRTSGKNLSAIKACDDQIKAYILNTPSSRSLWNCDGGAGRAGNHQDCHTIYFQPISRCHSLNHENTLWLMKHRKRPRRSLASCANGITGRVQRVVPNATRHGPRERSEAASHPAFV